MNQVDRVNGSVFIRCLCVICYMACFLALIEQIDRFSCLWKVKYRDPDISIPWQQHLWWWFLRVLKCMEIVSCVVEDVAVSGNK